MKTVFFVVIKVILATAYPADPVFGKFSEGLRYDYMEKDDGKLELVDNWMKISDYDRLLRYNPDASNQYHLFTRSRYPISQVLVTNMPNTVLDSFFDASKQTIVLMHGFGGSITSGFNTVLVPAFLDTIDCNVIVLDWSAGSLWGPRATAAVCDNVTGEAAGRFLNWLINLTGLSPANLHLVGYSVGGHGVAAIGRTVNGNVGYITGCDPADRYDAGTILGTDAASYTEVIHTNIGNIGIREAIGHVDFYPNGGRNMPGCMTPLCDHYRSYYYLAESVRTGGFTGQRCATVNQAVSGSCNEPGTLRLGGWIPKTGSTGIYHLRTNPLSPFSQG